MIGIFGGSFNPIHMGHLILTDFIRQEFQLEKVLFIPAKNPPHKEKEDLASSQHRYNMVQFAIAGNPYFEISSMEINRKGVSYTAETLSELAQVYPDKKLYFICGADSIINLPTWNNIKKIFQLANIIVAGRPEIPEVEFKSMIHRFEEEYDAKIFCSAAPLIDISATEVRKILGEGKSARYMLPEAVLHYIELHRVY